MPSIIISESEFEKLSEATKKEISKLVENAFILKTEEGEFSDGYNLKKEWYNKRNLAHSNRALGENYHEYKKLISELLLEAPKALAVNAETNFSCLSIEMAISLLYGLSNSSQNLLKRLLTGPATRDELAALVGGLGKVNGSVGSINRRLARRFDYNIYGDNRKEIKLIDFDGSYKLSCDALSIKSALDIIDAGWNMRMGDIYLTFNAIQFPKNANDLTIKLDSEAIKFANLGHGFIKSIDWDYEDEFGNIDVRNQVGLSFYSATICVNHRDGPEWGTDDSLDNNLIGFMHEQPIISFQNQEC